MYDIEQILLNSIFDNFQWNICSQVFQFLKSNNNKYNKTITNTIDYYLTWTGLRRWLNIVKLISYFTEQESSRLGDCASLTLDPNGYSCTFDPVTDTWYNSIESNADIAVHKE